MTKEALSSDLQPQDKDRYQNSPARVMALGTAVGLKAGDADARIGAQMAEVPGTWGAHGSPSSRRLVPGGTPRET